MFPPFDYLRFVPHTRNLAIFIAESVHHGLRSPSSPAVLRVLERQQYGILPLTLKHLRERSVYNFFTALIMAEKLPELHVIVGKAVCDELLFQLPKVASAEDVYVVHTLQPASTPTAPRVYPPLFRLRLPPMPLRPSP